MSSNEDPEQPDDPSAGDERGADPPVDPTRRDVAPTSRDVPAAPPTRRDTPPTEGAGALLRLPTALQRDYEVERELAADGAEADLLVVRELSTGDPFVVKIYRRGITVEPELLQRVAGLDPRFVVRVVAWGQSDDRCYEVLEYLPEGSLADLIRSSDLPMSPALVRDIVADLASALRCLHAAGIVHRDLKPANVLIRTDAGDRPRRVLGDFGLAVASQESLVFLSASRTVAYAAPEAASGAVAPARDYWSLGVIVLELLTGAHPFAGLSEAVINAQLATRPVDTSAVEDARWRNLCRGLLVRDPSHRWGAHEIEAWLDGAELEVQEDQPTASTSAQTPYRIGDAVASTNEDLARALADNWSEAKDRVGRNLVLEWLEKNWLDTNAVAAAHRALTSKGDAEARLYRLVRALDPTASPTFRGHRLDAASLGRLADAAAAAAADEEALEALRALLHLTTALEESGHGGELPELVRTWASATTYLRVAASQVHRAGGPSLGDDVMSAADIQLLSLTVAPEGLSTVRPRATAAATSSAREQPWFADLGTADDAPAPVLLLLALLAPEAERQTAREHARQAEEAAHDERVRGRRAEFGSEESIQQRIADLQERLADTDDIGSGLMIAPFIWFAGCLVSAAVLGLLWLLYKAMGLPGSDGDPPVAPWVLAYLASAVFALRSPALKMRNRVMTPQYRSEIARLDGQLGCGDAACQRCGSTP